MKPIKVVIVDDSLLIQRVLSNLLNSDPDIIVVGLAQNPIIGRQIIKTLNPDVLILDIEMPEMDGLTFLEKLMKLRPMPVLMCSAYTPHSREVTLEAFRLGVIDIISKPITQHNFSEILEKVKGAAIAKVSREPVIEAPIIDRFQYKPNENMLNKYVFAVGASTGGTEALNVLFQSLPKNIPPVVVTQHLPEGFGELFIKRINQSSALEIKAAKNGERLLPGNVYVALGDQHLQVESNNDELYIKLTKPKTVDSHHPSIDVMLESVARTMGDHSIGVLLTGMGSDGAHGMLAVKQAGGITIAQDEETSVVWGMPRVAVELNAANFILPLNKIPEKLLKCINSIGR